MSRSFILPVRMESLIIGLIKKNSRTLSFSCACFAIVSGVASLTYLVHIHFFRSVVVWRGSGYMFECYVSGQILIKCGANTHKLQRTLMIDFPQPLFYLFCPHFRLCHFQNYIICGTKSVVSPFPHAVLHIGIKSDSPAKHCATWLWGHRTLLQDFNGPAVAASRWNHRS